MDKMSILEELAAKGTDVSALADRVIAEREQIPRLVEALLSEKSSKKYGCEKALRLVSERRPELIYPYFDVFSSMLDNENSFLKGQ